MTLSIAQLSDRIEIQDVLVAYTRAVDTGDWEALGGVFTADADIDYTEMGGPRGDLDEVRAFLEPALAGFSACMHLVGLPAVELDGDSARARTACHNPMVIDGQMLLIGLWYEDELARTPAGWRIARRRTSRCHLVPLPAG